MQVLVNYSELFSLISALLPVKSSFSKRGLFYKTSYVWCISGEGFTINKQNKLLTYCCLTSYYQRNPAAIVETDGQLVKYP